MSNRIRHLLRALAAVAALLLAPVAAASPGAVVRDCATDGTLDGSYSDADKRDALDQIPADLAEYSECRALISGAIGGAKASASSSGPAGGAGAKSPEARMVAARRAKKAQAAREARRRLAREVRERKLGPRAVDPRDAGVLGAANTANGVPLPLMLAVVALALLALAGGLLTIWRRDPRLAGAVRRFTPPRLRR